MTAQLIIITLVMDSEGKDDFIDGASTAHHLENKLFFEVIKCQKLMRNRLLSLLPPSRMRSKNCSSSRLDR